MSNSALSPAELQTLEQIATKIRINIIKMLAQAGSGHPAGSLGMTDIFTTLYFSVLNHHPPKPTWPGRDYVFLSNGHICPVLYATLAEAGYFAESELETLRQINSRLQGHPHYRVQSSYQTQPKSLTTSLPQPALSHSLPGIEITSGPLGQGLSQAAGLAYALRLDKKPNHIFCFLSDGEQQEGQTWEAYLWIATQQLSNLTVIIDRNHIQISGRTEEVLPLEPLADKLKSFGWQTIEIDGHDFQAIFRALNEALAENPIATPQPGPPVTIIAHTTPGKGVSFMENKSNWHGQVLSPEEATQALIELS